MPKNYSVVRMGKNSRVKGWNSLRGKLKAKSTGVALVRFDAGGGHDGFHKHKKQEEIYFIVEGSCRFSIDGRSITCREGDVVRIAPQAVRKITNPSKKSCLIFMTGASGKYAAKDGVHM